MCKHWELSHSFADGLMAFRALCGTDTQWLTDYDNGSDDGDISAQIKELERLGSKLYWLSSGRRVPKVFGFHWQCSIRFGNQSFPNWHQTQRIIDLVCTDKNSGYETVVLVGITKCKLWQRTLPRQQYISLVITTGKICLKKYFNIRICMHSRSPDLSDELSQDWCNGFVSRASLA